MSPPRERHTHLDRLAVATLLLCCTVWGLGQVASKVALVEVPPLLQAAARSLGAAVLVALWARWRGIALLQRDGTLGAGLTAGLLFAAEFGCIFSGLQFTSASRMVVFIYLAPFVVALGMPLIARSERLDAWQSIGLLAAFAGVAWAFAEGFQRPSVGQRQWLGDALGVAGAVLWGLTTLVIRGSRLSHAAPEKTLFYQLAVSGVALALDAGARAAGRRGLARRPADRPPRHRTGRGGARHRARPSRQAAAPGAGRPNFTNRYGTLSARPGHTARSRVIAVRCVVGVRASRWGSPRQAHCLSCCAACRSRRWKSRSASPPPPSLPPSLGGAARQLSSRPRHPAGRLQNRCGPSASASPCAGSR